MKEIAMEDVHSIGLEAMDIIEVKLKEFDITLTPKQEGQLPTAEAWAC